MEPQTHLAPVPLDPQLLSVQELYETGYRAKRTGKYLGAVRDPEGNIYRLNIRMGTCSCQAHRQGANRGCLHLIRFTALRCYQRSVKAARQAAEEQV